MTPEQELYRASRAKEVLENEVFIEAFEQMQAEIRKQWEESPARDTPGREHLWVMLKQLQKMHSLLQGTMLSGKLASKEIQHRELQAKQSRAWKSESTSD